MRSIVDSIINSFSSSLRPFDPKRKVSTIIESFWFNKQRLILLIFRKEFFFHLSNLSSGVRNESLFEYANRSCKVGLESLEN